MKLLERIPRGVILTKQGEGLFKAAEKALEVFTRAEMLMLEQEGELQGTLKIATTMAIASVWIMPHIGDFLKKNPRIRLTVVGNDEELDLKTRQADVSVRPFMANQPELIQELIAVFHLKLYASSEYLKKCGTPKMLEDLDQHQLIVFGYDTVNPYNDINWPLKLGMPEGLLRDPYLCINTSSGMRQAAEDGHGIIALAEEFPGLAKSNLVEVLSEIEKPNIPIYYVYPKQLSSSKRVMALGKYFREKLVDCV